MRKYYGSLDQDTMILNGTSLAFTLSPIPFEKPFGAVVVSFTKDSKLSCEESLAQRNLSLFNLFYVGNSEGVLFLNLECNEKNVSQEQVEEAILFAKEQVSPFLKLQTDLSDEFEIEKYNLKFNAPSLYLNEMIERNCKQVFEEILGDSAKNSFSKRYSLKNFVNEMGLKTPFPYNETSIAFKNLENKVITENIVGNSKRITENGREFISKRDYSVSQETSDYPNVSVLNYESGNNNIHCTSVSAPLEYESKYENFTDKKFLAVEAFNFEKDEGFKNQKPLYMKSLYTFNALKPFLTKKRISKINLELSSEDGHYSVDTSLVASLSLAAQSLVTDLVTSSCVAGFRGEKETQTIIDPSKFEEENCNYTLQLSSTKNSSISTLMLTSMDNEGVTSWEELSQSIKYCLESNNKTFAVLDSNSNVAINSMQELSSTDLTFPGSNFQISFWSKINLVNDLQKKFGFTFEIQKKRLSVSHPKDSDLAEVKKYIEKISSPFNPGSIYYVVVYNKIDSGHFIHLVTPPESPSYRVENEEGDIGSGFIPNHISRVVLTMDQNLYVKCVGINEKGVTSFQILK